MNIQTSKVLMALLAVCFLDTLVLAYIILRSRWTGWRLIATVFFVFYGVMTFISQIESMVFHILPSGVLPRLFLMGVLVAAPFSLLAVLILGKGKADTSTINEPNSRCTCLYDLVLYLRLLYRLEKSCVASVLWWD
jgi:hypothetical protein